MLQRINLILTGLNFYFILEKESVSNYYDTKKDIELYFKDVLKSVEPTGIPQQICLACFEEFKTEKAICLKDTF